MRNNIKTTINSDGFVKSQIRKVSLSKDCNLTEKIEYLPYGNKNITETIINKEDNLFQYARVNKFYSNGGYKYTDYQRLKDGRIRVIINDHSIGLSGYSKCDSSEKIYNMPASATMDKLLKLFISKYNK